jgi:hypothetical protein
MTGGATPSPHDTHDQARARTLPLPRRRPVDDTCWNCNQPGITYQLFSAGREYWCPTCEDAFRYLEDQAPRRVQMMADGRFDELRDEMRQEKGHRSAQEGQV